jgi:hypothetical protein
MLGLGDLGGLADHGGVGVDLLDLVTIGVREDDVAQAFVQLTLQVARVELGQAEAGAGHRRQGVVLGHLEEQLGGVLLDLQRRMRAELTDGAADVMAVFGQAPGRRRGR